MQKLTKGFVSAIVLAGMSVFAASANAVLIDFNSPTYSNGSLSGQNGWVGDPNNLVVVNNPADGKLQISQPASGVQKSTFTFASPVTPGLDNLIHLSVDLTAGTVGGSFIGLLLFKDSAGIELSRSQIQAFLIRGRGAGGAGVVTSSMTVGGSDPNTRTLYIELDSVAKTAAYYKDSITGANLLGTLAWGAGALSHVAKVEVNTAGNGNADTALIDNINVVPEPATIAFLALGALPMLRRRRMA